MYITNVIDDDNLTLCNCTSTDNNIEIIIPLFTINPCGILLICLISLMVYTLIKLLIRKKNISNEFCFKNMYWHWTICDKVIYEEFRTNHLQSGNHKRLANSIIGKYIFVNPIRVDETVAEFLRLHYRKYEKFLL